MPERLPLFRSTHRLTAARAGVRLPRPRHAAVSASIHPVRSLSSLAEPTPPWDPTPALDPATGLVPSAPYEAATPLAGSVAHHTTHVVLHPHSRARPATTWPSHVDSVAPLLSELASRAKPGGSLEGCVVSLSDGGGLGVGVDDVSPDAGRGDGLDGGVEPPPSPSLRDWDPQHSKFLRAPPGSAAEEERFVVRAYRPGRIVTLGPLSLRTLDQEEEGQSMLVQAPAPVVREHSTTSFRDRLERAFAKAPLQRASSGRLRREGGPSVAPLPESHEAHIYVCNHGMRDCRCGVAGEELLRSLRQQVESWQRQSGRGDGRLGGKRVRVSGISHIGGHKFAANAIVHPHGDWYGNLRASDAPLLLRAALAPSTSAHDVRDERESLVHWPRWRGRLGMDEMRQLEHFALWGPAVVHSAVVKPATRRGGVDAHAAPPGGNGSATPGQPQGDGTEAIQRSPSSSPPSSSASVSSSSSFSSSSDAGATVTIRFFTHDGEEHVVESQKGETLMEVAVRHALPPIEATCGGKCECATCHAYLASNADKASIDDAVGESVSRTNAVSDEEEDMLEYAIDRRAASRLLCQVRVDDGVATWAAQGGVVRLPRA